MLMLTCWLPELPLRNSLTPAPAPAILPAPAQLPRCRLAQDRKPRHCGQYRDGGKENDSKVKSQYPTTSLLQIKSKLISFALRHSFKKNKMKSHIYIHSIFLNHQTFLLNGLKFCLLCLLQGVVCPAIFPYFSVFYSFLHFTAPSSRWLEYKIWLHVLKKGRPEGQKRHQRG